MNHTQHNQIVNFIWGVADDVLRDVYVRGKYRDIILPFTVLRRLDAILEGTKEDVLARHTQLNEMNIENQELQLRRVAGYPFYNISRFTFKKLLNDPANIRQNLENYLDGFSANVQDIIIKFKLRNQFDTLEDANITFPLIEKFTSSYINLSPLPTPQHEGLSNLGMGYVFEELIRKFNEENNEEAGEHFTPREIIQLMTHLIFEPIKEKLQAGTYLIYDPACGSGGMLTEAEKYAKRINPDAQFRLYGQEVNPETYAICKADLLIKDEDPDNIKFGSTLSNDGFPNLKFDFMFSNPPYGKAWKNDLGSIVDDKKKGEIIDARFKVGVPRVSDGQLLFLQNMVHKMKAESDLGSRIASVHNGSALFTGDAGGGESEIRKNWLENDWLEAIVQLPNGMFYNTGISTYIWIVTNRKEPRRKGKVQLIDASQIFQKMRKNMGAKSNEFSAAQIQQITDLYLNFEETDVSRIFDTTDFGYYSITVERPLRLAFELSDERVGTLAGVGDLAPVLADLQAVFGKEEQLDFNRLDKALTKALKARKMKLTAKGLKQIMDAISYKHEDAAPVIKQVKDGETSYQPDSDLRDSESIPLKEDIQEYFAREVLPFVPDAWIDHSRTAIGYEVSFTKIFYQYQPLRELADITANILALEAETDGLIKEIIA